MILLVAAAVVFFHRIIRLFMKQCTRFLKECLVVNFSQFPTYFTILFALCKLRQFTAILNLRFILNHNFQLPYSKQLFWSEVITNNIGKKIRLVSLRNGNPSVKKCNL